MMSIRPMIGGVARGDLVVERSSTTFNDDKAPHHPPEIYCRPSYFVCAHIYCVTLHHFRTCSCHSTKVQIW
jgi:hypothetical protein